MSDSKVTSITAALGSVIGYLGGEVSQRWSFERLLWPQRYYHHIDVLDYVKMSLLLPMGGPIHRAALETLDGFLRQGLYKGGIRGDMLGTAFFSEQESIAYYHRTASSEVECRERKKVRNGFWPQVLKHTASKHRTEAKLDQLDHRKQDRIPGRRTTHTVYTLDLRCLGQSADISRQERTQKLSEDKATFQTFIGIVLSETSTIAVAVTTSVWLHNYWLTSYLCVPLALRSLALIFSVRREALQVPVHRTGSEIKNSSLATNSPGNSDLRSYSDERADPQKQMIPHGKSEQRSEPKSILELDIPNNGFAVIISAYPLDNTVLQFFRHYGHPIRHSAFDRMREIISMAIVWAFVLYFPAGLIVSVWMDTNAQFLWLAYETYTVAAMHLVRLAGWSDCGRIETKVAEELERGNTVLLESGGVLLSAHLEMEEVESYALGQCMVKDILEDNGKQMMASGRCPSPVPAL